MSKTHRYRAVLVADIHGDVENTRRAVRFHLSRKADAFLVAGDVGSRAVWPVAPDATEKERDTLRERGYFPFKVTQDEHRRFEEYVKDVEGERPVDKERVTWVEELIERGRNDPDFKQFTRQSLRDVLDVLTTIRKQPVVIVLGEQDYFNAERVVEEVGEDHPNIVHAHGRAVPLGDDLAVVGLGRVVELIPAGLPTSLIPWESYYLNTFHTQVLTQSAPRLEYSEEEYGRLLLRAYRKAEGRRIILLSHIPPYRSGADIGILSDTEDEEKFKVFFVGSKMVAKFAQRSATAVVGCGHVHSCVGVTYLEGTPVVNPGQLRMMENPIMNLRTYRDPFAREYVAGPRWDAIGCGGAMLDLGQEIDANRFEV